MTTLKTPTLTQWRKLCEMAGWSNYKDEAYAGEDGKESIWYKYDDLPNNTTALMRLMDELFGDFNLERQRNDKGAATFGYACSVDNQKEFTHGNGIDCAVLGIQAAACDILAQLAVAEGIE